MPGLTDTDGLTDLQRDILGAVREFTDAEIIPVAGELDRTDTYPGLETPRRDGQRTLLICQTPIAPAMATSAVAPNRAG